MMDNKQSVSPNIDNFQFQQFLDAIPILILVKGPKSTILWANKTFQNYYGMDNDQLKGMIDASFNNPDYTSQYVKDDLYVFNTGKALDIPIEPITRFDGKIRYFHTLKSPIFNKDKQVIMTIGVSTDITEEKINQDKTKEHIKRIEKLNNLMVNRELKMIELKKTIENLKKCQDTTDKKKIK